MGVNDSRSSSHHMQILSDLAACRRTCEQEEDAPLHAAQHGDEHLADEEGEQHVAGCVQRGPSSPGLQWLHMTLQGELCADWLCKPEQVILTLLHGMCMHDSACINVAGSSMVMKPVSGASQTSMGLVLAHNNHNLHGPYSWHDRLW